MIQYIQPQFDCTAFTLQLLQSIMSVNEPGASRVNFLPQYNYPFLARHPFRRQGDDSQKSIKARLSPIFSQCLQMLCQMQDHQFGYFFKWPVNPYALRLEKYWEIVKRPMDLFTIRHKIMNKFYKTYSDFDKDMNLMISNSELYNKENKEIMEKISHFKKDYQQIFGIGKIKIQAIERGQMGSRKKTFSNYLDSYFTQQKRVALGASLSKFDEKSRSKLVQALKEKFPQIQISNSCIELSSLTGIQLKYILDVASSSKKVRKITRSLHPHQIKKKKAKKDEESSFEIEEDSK